MGIKGELAHWEAEDFGVTLIDLTQPHTSIKIVNLYTGETVKIGESGELCSRAFSNMKGYYNMPEKTMETIDADGWLHSGDLAVMRPDGYINIVGRVKDMIIRGAKTFTRPRSRRS
jgi:fatty-acyl-CoA synthase